MAEEGRGGVEVGALERLRVKGLECVREVGSGFKERGVESAMSAW